MKTVTARINFFRDLAWLLTGRDCYSPLDDVFEATLATPRSKTGTELCRGFAAAARYR